MAHGSLKPIGVYGAFGARVEIYASPPLDTELTEALADLRVPDGAQAADERIRVELVDGDEPVWHVRWNDTERYTGPETHLALYDTLIVLNQIAARRAAANGFAVLHGGCAAIDGRAFAVVGHSHAGKSTLTTALTRAGWGFIADEVVAVDSDGIVHPFHRPIGLRRGGAEHLGFEIPDGPYDSVYPYRVGAKGTLTGPTPLTSIKFLQRSDALAPATRRVPPAEALYELATQTLGASTLERKTFKRLEMLVRTTPTYELRYAHVADGASAVGQVDKFARH